jgi:hypothetical protein
LAVRQAVARFFTVIGEKIGVQGRAREAHQSVKTLPLVNPLINQLDRLLY